MAAMAKIAKFRWHMLDPIFLEELDAFSPVCKSIVADLGAAARHPTTDMTIDEKTIRAIVPWSPKLKKLQNHINGILNEWIPTLAMTWTTVKVGVAFKKAASTLQNIIRFW